MSLQDDEVFGSYYDDEVKKAKKKPPKRRSTEIFLTLNLNERLADMDQEQKIRFKDFGVALFDHRKILGYFKSKTNPSDPTRDMDKVKISWKVEVGPKSGKLHFHALISIEHHGFLTFRPNELREDAKTYFGHPIYLSCPISSNERVKWENYISKGFQDVEINK